MREIVIAGLNRNGGSRRVKLPLIIFGRPKVDVTYEMIYGCFP
jgi:hypothetical protein